MDPTTPRFPKNEISFEGNDGQFVFWKLPYDGLVSPHLRAAERYNTWWIHCRDYPDFEWFTIPKSDDFYQVFGAKKDYVHYGEDPNCGGFNNLFFFDSKTLPFFNFLHKRDELMTIQGKDLDKRGYFLWEDFFEPNWVISPQKIRFLFIGKVEIIPKILKREYRMSICFQVPDLEGGWEGKKLDDDDDANWK